MAYNRVVTDIKNLTSDSDGKKILYETRKGLSDACDWMMARADELDNVETYAEEVQEDVEVTGWWSIDDLFDENPGGWELPDGTVIIREEEG